MKRLTRVLLAIGMTLAACVTTTSCASSEATNVEAVRSDYVYICTGPKAKVYHSTPRCSGLNNCSRSVKKIPRSSTSRRGCRRCT